ncbi:GFA family protein [uncultured Aquitalea sp.]|uniref:GFA family protein n=1 Tax=uncultured Aquitalea sp. TaxID=540272 RepID=UPI0025CBB66D|nr:GFA family protein [uncultured Aquitalea sp.]
MADILHGHCLCGALSYQCRGKPLAVTYCHCRACQLASGAPVYLGALYPREAVSWQGATTAYRSSPLGLRHFCPVCGSTLFYECTDGSGQLEITVPTLEHPEALPAECHEWTRSAIPGFDIADALPRHPEGAPGL